MIQQLTGVGYHPGHVWKLLRHRLHYRLQGPARRAVQQPSGRSPAGLLRTGSTFSFLRYCGLSLW